MLGLAALLLLHGVFVVVVIEHDLVFGLEIAHGLGAPGVLANVEVDLLQFCKEDALPVVLDEVVQLDELHHRFHFFEAFLLLVLHFDGFEAVGQLLQSELLQRAGQSGVDFQRALQLHKRLFFRLHF